jgi:hypothetical protein
VRGWKCEWRRDAPTFRDNEVAFSFKGQNVQKSSFVGILMQEGPTTLTLNVLNRALCQASAAV